MKNSEQPDTPRLADQIAGGEFMPFKLEPLSSPIGREVVGLDVSTEIPLDVAEALRDAWLEHGFLVFRGVCTSPDVQLRVSRSFGELEPHSIPVCLEKLVSLLVHLERCGLWRWL